MKKGWKIATLGDVLAVLKNGVNCKQDKSGKGQRISRIESIASATFDMNRVGYASLSEAERKKYRLERGDILFSHINSAIHVGKTATFDIDEDVYHGVNLLLMRPKAEVASGFLNMYLKHLFEMGYWRTRCKQSVNQASVNQQDINRVPIRYPIDCSEQHRIVAILEEAFVGIATAKANAEKNLKNVNLFLESSVQSIFSQVGQAGSVVTLDKLSENLDNKRIPITKGDREPGDYPYYGASGIVDYVKRHIFEGEALLVSEDGANLLARSTPIAFSVSGKYWVNNHAHILKFKDMATQRYVEFYLESIKINEFVTGMAQPKLTQKALYLIPIPIPDSVSGRQAVVSEVEMLYEVTNKLKSAYEQKLSALDELKQSLLHRAFNGDL